MTIKANDAINTLTDYQPGQSGADLGSDTLLKLSSNENPHGSALNQTDLKKSFSSIERYPNCTQNDLITTLANRHNLAENQLILGNGSDELFQLVCMAYINQETEAISAAHTFSVYKNATLAVGGKFNAVSMVDYEYDLDLMLSSVNTNTRVIFIANLITPPECY